MPLKIITLEDLELTEEEMQEIIDTEWGRHIPPLIAVGRGNRAINKAVAEKCMEILNRSINPMELVKNLLEANKIEIDKHNEISEEVEDSMELAQTLLDKGVTVDPDYLDKISKDSDNAKL